MPSELKACSDESTNISTTDRQIIACNNTFQIFKNFNVVKEALAFVTVLIDSKGTTSVNKSSQIKQIVKQSVAVINFLSIEYMRQLDSLTRVSYLKACMHRLEKETKFSQVHSNVCDSPKAKLKRLYDVVVKTSARCENTSHETKSKPAVTRTPEQSSEPRYARRVIEVKSTGDVPSFPLPLNRRIYSPTELVNNYLALETGKTDALKLWCTKGYIPVTLRQAQRIIASFKRSGRVQPNWNLKGRERIMPHDVSYDAYQSMMNGSSTCVSKKSIGNLLKLAKTEKAKEKGLLLLGSKAEVSKCTIERYHKEISVRSVLNGQGSVVLNPKLQSDHRHAAEQSLRSCTSFIMTVLSTHFLPSIKNQNPFFQANKHLLGDGANKTIDLLEKNLGYEVTPLDAAYVTSTDDTSLYIKDDVIERRYGTDWHVLSKEGNEVRKFRNTKNVGGKKDPNHGGFRVKLCFTISASGQMADLVVIINGLTHDELPMTNDQLKQCRGMRVLEIPGLTPGTTLNPQNKECGYLVFCRGNIAGVDSARHEWYDKIVFDRFVKNLREERKEIYQLDSPIFRSWRDGDFSQINALPMQYIKHRWDVDKIGYNKQSANRSGTEQAADLWDCFKFLKRKANSTTMKGKEDTIVMHRVRKYLRQNQVCLKGKHESCLLSFLGRLPEIMGRVATRTNIKEAFVRNGMLDKETSTCPDIYEMMNTLPGTLSKMAHDLILGNFDELFNIQQRKGRIYDEDFQRMGFPKDKYFDGTEFERTSEYAPRLRAFDMSHDFYMQYQQKIMMEMKKSEFEKLMAHFVRGEKVFNNARLCEEIVIGNMKKDGLQNCLLSESQMKHFASNNCTAEKLRDFIKCRSWSDLNTTAPYFQRFGIGNKFPNRMKITEALAGIDCLITRAFNVRLSPITLIPPAKPNEDYLLPESYNPWEGPTVHRT